MLRLIWRARKNLRQKTCTSQTVIIFPAPGICTMTWLPDGWLSQSKMADSPAATVPESGNSKYWLFISSGSVLVNIYLKLCLNAFIIISKKMIRSCSRYRNNYFVWSKLGLKKLSVTWHWFYGTCICVANLIIINSGRHIRRTVVRHPHLKITHSVNWRESQTLMSYNCLNTPKRQKKMDLIILKVI